MEIKVTRKEIAGFVKSLGLKPAYEKRVMAIVDAVGVDGFADSTTLAWSGAYKALHPDNKYGLGDDSVKTLAKVQKFVRDLKFGKRVEDWNAAAKETDVKKRVEALEVEVKALEARKDELTKNVAERMAQLQGMTFEFTRAQMRVIADEMELHNLETVDLRMINDFWKVWGFREFGKKENKQ